MDWVEEFKKRFGGFWNTILLVTGLVICLRFTGAEWKDQALALRLLYALYLVLGVTALGIAWGTAAVILGRVRSGTSFLAPRTASHFVSGMKYGLTVGIVIVFTVGLLMVEDYLGPLKELFDVLVKKIGERIP